MILKIKNIIFTQLYFVLLFLSFIISTSSGKTYYLDSNFGNNNNSGVLESEAWKSISKINNHIFSPGDSILLRAGCSWRDELRISSSGTKKNPIVISSYGYGNNPKILGSSKILKWEMIGKNLWKSELEKDIGCIWYLNKNDEISWGIKKDNPNNVVSNFHYYSDTTSLVIYSVSAPNSNDLKIEASVREFGIVSGWYNNAKDFILIENLEILFTINSNIRAVGSKGWIIQDCILHHSGNTDESDGQGIQFEGEEGIFRNNHLFENGQHGIYISAFGNAPINSIIIEKNKVYNNYHTGIDIMNLGGGENGLKNITIRYNFVYDNENHNGKEIGIQLLAYPPGKIINSNIYYNIVHNINGIAFAIFPETDSISIFNNTAYEPESACFLIEGDSSNISLFNNIGVGNKYYNIISIYNTKNKIINNNIWYRRAGIIASVENKEFRKLQEYIKYTGFDRQSYNQDPAFVNASKFNFNLSKHSICIENGIEHKVQSDFFGNPVKGQPDIGAIEFSE